MKSAKFIILYSFGLATFLPFTLLSQKYDIVWLMFLAPILAVIVAEIFIVKIRNTENPIQSRIVSILIYCLLVNGILKFIVGENRVQGIVMLMGMGMIYQLPIILIFLAYKKRRDKLTEIENH